METFHCIGLSKEMFLLRFLGFLTLSVCCLADINSEICDVVTKSCGEVPPTLPSSFIMTGSKVDNVDKKFVWFEEYYDPDNLRAKYSEMKSGIESHFIYDYFNQQVTSYIKYNQGATIDKNSLSSVSCNSIDMDQSPFTKELGQKFGHYDPLMPRMYNAYESLRYGGPYAFAYSGTEDDPDRGTLAGQLYKGCVYDENYDATYDMTFSWSNASLNTPYGIRYPTRIAEIGGYYTEATGKETEPLWNPVRSVKSIATFQANPYMDNSIFQSPVRMICQNQRRREPRPLPIMPPAFSTSIELVSLTETWSGTRQRTSVFYDDLWYDADLRLVRFDHMPTDAEQLIFAADSFDSEGRISAVLDFNLGLTFYTNVDQGICMCKHILVSKDNFLLSNASTESNAVMATPSEILGIDSTLSYKGKYLVRDMDSYGYSAQVKGQPGQRVPVLKEIYVSAEGWHEVMGGKENFEFPVRDIQVFDIQLNGQDASAIEQTNYYKFQRTASSASAYDISLCAQNMTKKTFEFQLTATNQTNPPEELVKKQYSKFVNEAHLSLMYRANLGTPLRVQGIKVVFPPDKTIRLRFTLLEQFNVKGTVASPRLGLPLAEAVEALKKDLKTFSFFTVISNTATDETFQFNAVPDSFQELTVVKEVVNANSIPTDSSKESTVTEKEGEVKTAGYPKGAVAGLAIAMIIIGLALGGVMMIFYFKKFQLSTKDTETANFTLQESTGSS